MSLPSSLRRRSSAEMAQVSENARKEAAIEMNTIESEGFQVEPANPEAVSRLERLRKAVRQAGGNRVVAERSGVPLSSLGAYMQGKREWRIGAAVALAAACGVSLDWLASGNGSPNNDALPSTSSLPAPSGDGHVMIPRYDVRASAGSGTPVDQEDMLGLVSFEEMFLRRQLGLCPETLVTLEATGDSMQPTIRDGDLLLVDTANNGIQDGRIYVLSLGGFLIVKRLQVQSTGDIALISDNDRYPPQVISPSERDPLRVIGRVVYQAGPVRS